MLILQSWMELSSPLMWPVAWFFKIFVVRPRLRKFLQEIESELAAPQIESSVPEVPPAKKAVTAETAIEPIMPPVTKNSVAPTYRPAPPAVEERKTQLPCPHCKSEFDLRTVFSLGRVSLAQQGLVVWGCSRCLKESWLAFLPGKVAIGSGLPFVAQSSVDVPDLEFKAFKEAVKDGLEIRWKNQEWFVKSVKSVYKAQLAKSDASYLYYDYSVSDQKIAQIKVHRKRGTVEQVEAYTEVPEIHHLEVTKKFRRDVESILKNSLASVEWMA